MRLGRGLALAEPGKSGLVSRGSKVLLFPLESRRVPIERPEGM